MTELRRDEILLRLNAIRDRLDRGDVAAADRPDMEFMLGLLLDRRLGWAEALQLVDEVRRLRERRTGGPEGAKPGSP